MIFPRRLINIAGTLGVAGGLVAGTLLIALPVYIESVETRNKESQVAASNRLLVSQIEGLSATQAEMPRLMQELDELRAGLPRLPQLEDVAELTIRAAARTGATIKAVDVSAPAPFVLRGPDEVFARLPTTATDVTAAEPPSEDGGTPAGEPSPTDPAGDAETDSDPSGSTGADQLQIPVTITVTAPDTAAATRFLDELRAGPRLLQIDIASGTIDPETGEVALIVSGLVFARATK